MTKSLLASNLGVFVRKALTTPAAIPIKTNRNIPVRLFSCNISKAHPVGGSGLASDAAVQTGSPTAEKGSAANFENRGRVAATDCPDTPCTIRREYVK